ncbi:MAG: hypothetical protein JW873_03255 [Candidatus Saganbacteria bacterium]|nr:hypothetical protein [Candidatus Saganbacteria bacterium]
MDNRKLLESLLLSETEDEVDKIVTTNVVFQKEDNWKKYGALENNWGSVGSQQDEASSALVEKIVNSIDALLLLKCNQIGIDPKSSSAPADMFLAAERFFGVKQNRLHELSGKRLSELAQNIQLIATGEKGADKYPSLAIADLGEGQNPSEFCTTFLSLHKSNKMSIPFVQGKFNMGGTGVVRYCGKKYGYQLLISKRNPDLKGADGLWGFTLIRRQRPTGNRKNSVIQYFAPSGLIPTLDEKSLDLLPQTKAEKAEPYQKAMEWGTYIKLYEYQIRERSSIILDLFVTLNKALHSIALPIRLIECRTYGGHSPEINLIGLDQRLEADRSDLLDKDFPASSYAELGPLGKVRITYYLFNYELTGKQAERWLGREPIYFTINGQTHARLPSYFLCRQNVRLDYLEKHLLIHIDCSAIPNDLVEDLFMSSRDRMVKGVLRDQIEDDLEKILKSHTGLCEKNEEYRQKRVKNKIEDETIKLDALNKIISSSPILAKLFGKGIKLSNPFMRGQKEAHFQGKRYPTYFRIAKKHEGVLLKECPTHGHCVILFETDAQNDYLTRLDDPGKLEYSAGKNVKNVFLFNGLLHLEFHPRKEFKAGDRIDIEVKLSSPDAPEGYYKQNFQVLIVPVPKEQEKGKKKKRRLDAAGLALPKIYEVHKDEWASYSWGEEDAIEIDKTESKTDAFINIDNIYLRRELDKDSKSSEIIKEQFKWGMVLVALGVKEKIDGLDHEGDAKKLLQEVTQGMSQVILPIIRSLSKLDQY